MSPHTLKKTKEKKKQKREHAPLPAIIDDKLEDTMSVRYPELSGVCARRARDGHQPGADMRVEHRKIELHIFNTGVGNPASGRWVKPCYIEGIDLFHEIIKGRERDGVRQCFCYSRSE